MDDELDGIKQIALEANEEERYPCAVELLEPYLRKRPKDAHAWVNYGMALDRIGRFGEAESAFLQSIKVCAPHLRFVPQTSLGLLYNRWGAFDKAEQVFSLACRSKYGQKTGSIWILRGQNYLMLGKFKHAESCLRAATTMKHGDPDEAYLNLGAAFVAQRKYKEAENALKKALKINPKYKEAKQALNSLKDIAKAIQKAKSIR